MREYQNMRTADIVAEALLDWKVDVIFGLPGDGINGLRPQGLDKTESNLYS